VETLLERGADGDVAEAKGAIERLAAAPTDDGLVIREVWLLRLRALLARARGDETGYRDYRDRYHAMATSLGYEGHIEVGRGDAMRPGRQRVRRSSAAEFVTAFGYQPCQRSDVRLSRAVNAASVSKRAVQPLHFSYWSILCAGRQRSGSPCKRVIAYASVNKPPGHRLRRKALTSP
jgi:hypothetical protein